MRANYDLRVSQANFIPCLQLQHAIQLQRFNDFKFSVGHHHNNHRRRHHHEFIVIVIHVHQKRITNKWYEHIEACHSMPSEIVDSDHGMQNHSVFENQQRLVYYWCAIKCNEQSYKRVYSKQSALYFPSRRNGIVFVAVNSEHASTRADTLRCASKSI